MFLFFTLNDPNDVGLYPPTILNSAWYSSIEGVAPQVHTKVFDNVLVAYSEFSSLDQVYSFITTYSLNDSALKDDLSAWTTAHNITYNWKVGDTVSEDVNYYLDHTQGTPITGWF